ncbi:MAG TPA: sulfatase-like hydrolase/transferase [Myxococcota bacterium]|nr:sulfatase-like hydrolase/transferase [Myxococcota bacterium]
MSSHPPEASRPGRALLLYAELTYAALVVHVGLLARNLPETGVAPTLFFLAALLDSCFLYLLPAFAPVALAFALAARLEARGAPRRAARAIVAVLAVALPGALQIAVFADRRIYEIFGFHVNGFVMNVIATPGGIDSMGGDEASTALFAAIALGLVALQSGLLVLAQRLAAREPRHPERARRRLLATVAALLALMLSERLAYAFAQLYGYTPLLDAAETLPWYAPVTILGIAQSLGFAPARIDAPHFRVASDRLRYPLAPIARADHPVRNIVWLVSESLRADMLDPEIMPATYAFARRALWFRDHYSGGNGTRMGMFTMFYGLHGSYWFPFLQHRRQPVLLDVLQQDGYQLGIFTSANFSYPEFDETIFAGVPGSQLHSSHNGGPGWQRDRQNVGELLDFVERRDPARPFFAFLFFESPHARYYFPPESVIRRPYLEDLSYATMNLQRDMPLIFNRYVNACHHLDSQFARVLDGLEQQHLLDSTIVVITGDHGEEFLEKGRWGHGSDFSEEQTRVPLVLWIPGESPREVTRLTSHADIPATLLARLGVVNPPSDYSIGFDLLGPQQRVDAVLADWNRIAVIDADAKLIFPMGASSLLQRLRATTRADAPLPTSEAHSVLEEKRPRFLEVVHDLARFSARG